MVKSLRTELGLRRRGFTLVELLVVIIIISITSSIAFPYFRDAKTASNEAKLRADLARVRAAAERFQLDTGFVPQSTAALSSSSMPASVTQISPDRASVTTVVSPTSAGFAGPYLSVDPVDPMKNEPYDLRIMRVSGLYTIVVRSKSTEIGSNGQAYYTW